MSQRSIPATDRRAVDQLRQFEDRLSRLENGGTTRGRVSFGETIVIGGVEVIVADAGGGAKTLTFRNATTGASSVITL